MRLAVIGTPRSGNSLLRKVLARAYGLAEAASHDPDYLLGPLPQDAVIQVHAPFSVAVAASLSASQVIVVSPRRHPLDVLLSMLHFAQFEPEVSQWLGGDYLAELGGVDPTSRAFAEFATGEGAGDLLEVSRSWLGHAHVTVEFSQLAADPTSVLQDEGLGAHRVIGDTHTLHRVASFDSFHQTDNMHGWMGQVGYWRRYIPLALAEEVRDAHRDVFMAEGYDIDGAVDLDVRQIRLDWAADFAGRAARPKAPAAASAGGLRTRLAARGSRRTRSSAVAAQD